MPSSAATAAETADIKTTAKIKRRQTDTPARSLPTTQLGGSALRQGKDTLLTISAFLLLIGLVLWTLLRPRKRAWRVRRRSGVDFWYGCCPVCRPEPEIRSFVQISRYSRSDRAAESAIALLQNA